MNDETRSAILMLVYRYTTFPISKIYWITEQNEIVALFVNGGRKSYTIKYNRGTDMFEGFNSKHDKTELFIEMVAEWITRAK